LWASHTFQRTIQAAGYILEPTASDASFQNGLAERPNRTLGDMTRALLHGAQLGPQYWSWALIHAVYLKNHLPHTAITMTPYQAYTGNRPNISKLRVFGSPVICRSPGKRPAKLDIHAVTGIFLGFTATEQNIYYQDTTSKCIKIATHVSFDEAGYTLPNTTRTQLQHTLQAAETSDPKPTLTQQQDIPIMPVHQLNSTPDPSDSLQVQRLTEHGRLPTRASEDAAGYDVYSSITVTIPPHSSTKIPLDIAVQPPLHTYCQILSRSGLFTKHHIEAKIGTIDRDYTGNIIVLLQNNSAEPYTVTAGDRIAQMVIYNIARPEITDVSSLQPTERGNKGFGSTGNHQLPVIHRTMAPAMGQILQEDGILPTQIWLSGDPFHHCIDIKLDIKGVHPTLGILAQPVEPYHHQLQLIDMAKGTPGHKIPRWRSILKRAIILSVDQHNVRNTSELEKFIAKA
jgi:dUTP pyrophosphatase